MEHQKRSSLHPADNAVGDSEETAEIDGVNVIVRGKANGFVQEIAAGPHRLVADESTTIGGTDTGASPYDLLVAALGTCNSMTVAMYARRKEWPLQDVVVSLKHSKVITPDGGSKTDRIERDISFVGPLTMEQRARLIEIANKCPLYQTLPSKIDIQTSEA